MAIKKKPKLVKIGLNYYQTKDSVSKPKKQPKKQYLYVARDKEICGCYSISNKKMKIVKIPPEDKCGKKDEYFFTGSINNRDDRRNPYFGIKLKPGKQKKVPILVDRAEDV